MIHAAHLIATYVVLALILIHNCWVPSLWDLLYSFATAGALVAVIFILSIALQMVIQ